MFKTLTILVVLAVLGMGMSAGSAVAGSGMRRPPAPLGKVGSDRKMGNLKGKRIICKRQPAVILRQRALGR